ncbi:MAG: hypothetical protein PW788_00805 [Micavibrio sp.]|nr:hypothetical protein [Micavibrio sp.]
MEKLDTQKLNAILEQAQKVAVEYYNLTGKPLGITGEIGECLVAKYLNVELAPPRAPGYDAIDRNTGELIQIKARKLAGTNRKQAGRVGAIKMDHEWHTTVLVILDDRFEAVAIYKATRAKLEEAIRRPGSKSRARGALAITHFISLADKVWPPVEV